jgi:hypothetical protein
MIKSSRAFDANERFFEYLNSVSVVQQNVFLFKGFLGPTIKDNDGLQTVGMRAARSAGVIVDSLGKLRCPPGTPNANQFTDMQMSNCMVPSAETLAQQAVDASAKLVDRASDGFKRGRTTRTVKAKELKTNPDIGFHDEDGFSTQKRVPKGNGVFSPVTGERKFLLELQDSVTHVAEGGALTDIPDEHLIEAILKNTGVKNWAEEEAIEEVFKNTGVRVNASEPKRFEKIGEGGGINGMTRLKDSKTGALLGIKYQNGTGTTHGDEAYNEIVAEIFGNHLGYEPMPMRFTFGVEEEMGNTGMKWNKGHSLVSELAHNRYEGDISSGAVSGDGESTSINSEEIVRLAIFDSILQNNDRHEANMLLATDEAGKNSALIPIDQSLAFPTGMGVDEDYKYWVKSVGGVMAVRLEMEAEKLNTLEGRKQVVIEIEKIQEELRVINREKLLAQIKEARVHLGQLGGSPESGREASIQDAIARIDILQNANSEELMRAMMSRFREPKPLDPESLIEWGKRNGVDPNEAKFDF